MKSWINLALLGMALLGAPAWGQQSQSPGPPSGSDTAPVTDPEAQRKLNEMKMEFLNTDGAIWVNRSINDTVYWAGYSPNSVYWERDSARTEKAMEKIPSREKVEALIVAPSSQTKEYEIYINGKVVPVQAQP